MENRESHNIRTKVSWYKFSFSRISSLLPFNQVFYGTQRQGNDVIWSKNWHYKDLLGLFDPSPVKGERIVREKGQPYPVSTPPPVVKIFVTYCTQSVVETYIRVSLCDPPTIGSRLSRPSHLPPLDSEPLMIFGPLEKGPAKEVSSKQE